MNVYAYAYGGTGGTGNSNGGAGGDAHSEATASNTGTQQVKVRAESWGGNGGTGSSGGGIGGDAVAVATGTGANKSIVNAKATGGMGAAGSNQQGRAEASATATGRDSGAVSEALSSGGLVEKVYAQALAPIAAPSWEAAATSQADALAGVSRAIPVAGDAQGRQAAALGIGLPSDDDITGALAGNPDAQQNFDVGGVSDILAYGFLSGSYMENGSGNSRTYQSILEFDFDVTSLLLDPRNLLAAFLDPFSTVDGFDSLRFRIFMEGSFPVDETFYDEASALAYFNDQTVDLGEWAGVVSGDNILDVTLQFYLTASSVGDGFGFDFVLGNSTIGIIPEPGTGLLFGAGLIGLAIGGRRRKA